MKVQLNLILGHRAVIRENKTPEGFTHDWEVFVKCDQGPIEAFVDRVIFNIHESFPKPRRVVKEPPFTVKESGYAGFMVDIEVLFKTKDDPKRADFKYDLYLQSDGGPITPSRKEKLIFNFPAEEFAKKLIKAGGVVHDKQSPTSSSGGSSSSYITSNPGGGKSSKHSTANAGSKSSPKNSFENLFGTPIKRSGPSLITSTSSSAGTGTIAGPSKDIKPVKSGKGSGGGKPDKVFGETIPSKTEKGSSKGQKSSSSQDSSPAEVEVSKTSYKPSKSGSKGKIATKNMLPPNSPLVPKKSKKSDIFEHSSSDERKRKSEKGKKKSKHSRSLKMNPVVVIKKEKIPNVSPISSSSSRSPSSSHTSPSLVNSDEDSDSGSSTPKMVPAISSTSATLSRKRSSLSQSPTSIDSPASSSSSASSIPLPKRRKHSSPSPGPPTEESVSARRDRPASSSHKEKKKSKNKKSSHSSSAELRKSRRAPSISSPDRRNYVVSPSAEQPSTTTSSRSRKSSKKSKKSGGKVKVFEDSLSSSSASESVSTDSPLSSSPHENGMYGMVNANGGCSTPTFDHASIAGSITAEMKLLKELHTKIHTLEDPTMLQTIVDIVEGCGKDHWSIDSGKTFDFDLCKLSSGAIKRLQKAIFYN